MARGSDVVDGFGVNDEFHPIWIFILEERASGSPSYGAMYVRHNDALAKRAT